MKNNKTYEQKSSSSQSWWDDWEMNASGSSAEEVFVYAVSPQGHIYKIDPNGEVNVVAKDYFHTDVPVRGFAIKQTGGEVGSSSID
jgi:hypothetical protein